MSGSSWGVISSRYGRRRCGLWRTADRDDGDSRRDGQKEPETAVHDADRLEMQQKDKDDRGWRSWRSWQSLLDNSRIVEASDEELDQIDPIPKDFTPTGGHYPPIFQVDTESSSTIE